MTDDHPTMDTWLGSIGYTSLKRMIPQYQIFHWFLMLSSWNKASWRGSWARLHQSIRSRSSRRQVKHIDCGASGGVRPEPCGERLCRWCQGGEGKMNRLFLGKWSGKWGRSFAIFIFDSFRVNLHAFASTNSWRENNDLPGAYLCKYVQLTQW